jgi:hypothetical protein
MNQDILKAIREMEWDNYQDLMGSERSLSRDIPYTQLFISPIVLKELGITLPLKFDDSRGDKLIVRTFWDVSSNKRKISYVLWQQKNELSKIAEWRESG